MGDDDVVALVVPEYDDASNDSTQQQPGGGGLSDAALEGGAKVTISRRSLGIGAAAGVLVVLIVLFAATPTLPRPVAAVTTTEKILYLGDPQIGMGNSGWEMDKARFAAAASVADGLTAVVVAGDVTNDWQNDVFAIAASEVLAMFNTTHGVHVTKGVHVVPGNHDMNPGASTAAEFDAQREHYRQNFGLDYHAFDTELSSFVPSPGNEYIIPNPRSFWP